MESDEIARMKQLYEVYCSCLEHERRLQQVLSNGTQSTSHAATRPLSFEVFEAKMNIIAGDSQRWHCQLTGLAKLARSWGVDFPWDLPTNR